METVMDIMKGYYYEIWDNHYLLSYNWVIINNKSKPEKNNGDNRY